MPALYNCQHQLALQSLLLGTHRRPLPEELEAVASQLGIDPELPIPERLLEVNSLLDRLRRTELQSLPAGTPRPAPPPTESQKPLGPKASRALELALGDTYQSALRELLQLVHQQDALVPPRLIVNLLDTANTLRRAGQSQLAEQFLALTGQRGQWLAAQHPEWSELLPPPDFATNYQRVVTPADKTLLLRQWRKTDPTAARLALAAEWPELTPKQQESRLPALRVGLSEADFPFLRAALVPRRRGVRQMASRLLLLGGEAEITDLLREMASSWLSGEDSTRLDPDPLHQPILNDHGLFDKKLGLTSSLLAHLPPHYWPELLYRSPVKAFTQLANKHPKTLPALMDAVIFYGDSASRLALMQYLAGENRPQQHWTKKTAELYDQLTAEEYAELSQWALKNVEQAFRQGSVMRHLSLQLPHPWPDRLSKLIVGEFTDQLSGRRQYYGFSPNRSWKLLPYRIDVQLFPWLRQQLFAATDRGDQAGSIATKMLQVASFRKAAREAIVGGL